MRRTEASWFDDVVADTIIVHLKSGGESLKGVLTAAYSDALQLRDAVVLDPDTQLEIGTVAVPRDNVDYVQVV